jgi:SAM-dependent methyltransferase
VGLQENLPFPAESFDDVYHSHVLEYFSRADRLRLLERCRRVLRAGGIIGIVVPDLEGIVRLYVSSLEKCVAGDQQAASLYDWAMLEMYDQTAREGSGVRMLAYVLNTNESQLVFVQERLGMELNGILEAKKQATIPARGADPGFRHRTGNTRRRAFRLLAGPDGDLCLRPGQIPQVR